MEFFSAVRRILSTDLSVPRGAPALDVTARPATDQRLTIRLRGLPAPRGFRVVGQEFRQLPDPGNSGDVQGAPTEVTALFLYNPGTSS